MAAKRGQYWQDSHIEKEQKDIRLELDAHADPKDDSKRLTYALSRIAQLEQDSTREGMLKRYIFVVSALVHHERHGGLKPAEIKHLFDLGTAIVRVFGVKPGFAKSARLQSDLLLVMSQIQRKEGKHWQAAWEHQMALHCARSNPAGGAGFQSLAMAIRAIRLGHASLALSMLDAAAAEETTPGVRSRIVFEKIRTLRIAGDGGAADLLAKKLGISADLTESMKLDLEWEGMCRRAQKSQDLGELVYAIKKKGSHHQASYIIEGFLWAGAVQSREWLDNMPKLATMLGALAKGKANQVELGHVFQSAMQLERCYDHEIPVSFRLADLGSTLSKAQTLLTIDKELLLWAAAARWLSRIKAFFPANLVISEYQGLCLRLSDGHDPDTLNLLSDMRSRDWFVKGRTISSVRND